MVARRRTVENTRLTTLPDLPDLDGADRETVVASRRTRQRAEPPTSHRATRARREPGRQHPALPPHRVPPPEPLNNQSDLLVLPPARQITAQALPNVTLAVCLVAAARGQAHLNPAGVPLWVALILAPCLIPLLVTDGATSPLWRRASFVNFITVGAVLPILVIARYVFRAPYLDGVHGPLLPPVLILCVAIFALMALGVTTAIVSREDPEYAGVLVLPACLLVPLCSGDTRVTTPETTLQAVSLVFVATAVSTVVASLLTDTLPALVAPCVFAIELMVLSVLRQFPSTPEGAASPVTVAFAALILTAGLLTAVVPMLSVFCVRVRRHVRRSDASRTVAAQRRRLEHG